MWRVDLYNDSTKETTPHSYPTEAEAEAAFVVLQAAHPKRLVLMWEDGVTETAPSDAPAGSLADFRARTATGSADGLSERQSENLEESA